MSERDRFYEQRDKYILPSRQWGWRDVREFLCLPAISISDFLYLRHIKKCYSNMKDPSSDENVKQMTFFLMKAIMENKKMCVDFLDSVGGYQLFESAQRKTDRIYSKVSDEFHDRTEKVWDDVCDIRYQRDANYCRSYFRKKPKRIASFPEGEMARILKRLPRRQQMKLLFIYLRFHGKEKDK